MTAPLTDSALAKVKVEADTQFGQFASQMVDVMKQVQSVAAAPPSQFLNTVGTTVLLLALFLRLRPFGVEISQLAPGEFIALLALSLALILAAAGLKVYQFRTNAAASRAIAEAGARLVQSSQEAALNVVRTVTPKDDGL